MIVWRISNHAILDGAGGLRASARWHTRGRRIVYCAPNPAAALLEVLVHLEIDVEDFPGVLQCLEILIPDDIEIGTTDAVALGADWALDADRTRAHGDEWLRSGHTAVLQVPSALLPATTNCLINPAHARAREIEIVRTHAHRIDQRLLR